MKRALVSVSDKTGLIDFLKPLVQDGLEVVSTGGTLKFLNEAGIKATDVALVTGFPEVLDGRVKTLHPHIHMGLLARKEAVDHVQQMEKHSVDFFDLVVGNLYPFEQTALNLESTLEDQIENIDIGGPSFLRSAAKNYHNIIVVCDPADYSDVLQKYQEKKLSLSDRKKLALKVFSLTSYYDALIVQKMAESDSDLKYFNLPLKKKQALRYGENSHQKANWYTNPLIPKNLAHAEMIQGKELSYNNLLDLDAAAHLVCEFDRPACVAVKHNNPCGAAIADSIFLATQKAYESDPKSIFGGILAFNQVVDLQTVEYLKSIFLECLIAPGYSLEALRQLSQRKNLRILKWPAIADQNHDLQMKSIMGGVLVQKSDSFSALTDFQNKSQVIGENPSEKIWKDIIFGEKVCAFLKSNSIALVYEGQTVGLGMGQVNRVDAVELAITRMKNFSEKNVIDLNRVVAVSDAFFPFADSISYFQKAGLCWIVQPGGSIKDAEVIQYAQSHKMNMILTGQRHFRH